MKRSIFKYILCTLVILNSACKKQDDWLNVKRIKSDVTPKTLSDYAAILDNDVVFNTRLTYVGLIGTDNILLTDANFNTVDQTQRNLYTFSKGIWADGTNADWSYTYTMMENANIVLDGLKDIAPTSVGYNNVKGQALFYRSLALYTLSQLYCKQFTPGTGKTDLGLPIRLSSDVNILYKRSSLEETYQQMISDAKAAIELTGPKQIYNRQPSKFAAYALLSKIYLVMADYVNAGIYADKALSGDAHLMDYNDNSLVTNSRTYPFPPDGLNNSEILFFASGQIYSILGANFSAGYVAPELYNTYEDNDLRKTFFFSNTSGNVLYIGNYCGDYPTFCGIAIDEMYLIRAESNARAGNKDAAMADINLLLKYRYKTGTFTNLTASDADAALNIVLRERRKELPFVENIRWEDLRRLNLEDRFKVTVTHIINGTTYTLLPNDPKYVLPVPDNEIQVSGLQQNMR